MKPLFKKNSDSNNSFTVKNTVGQSFDGLWHYHNEFELSYIYDGTGEKIIGDHVSELKKGQLLFLGSDLPHQFSCHPNYPYKDRAGSLTVHINKEFINERFFTYPEWASISRLIENAKYGVQFEGKTYGIAKRLNRLFKLNKTESVIELISILNTLSTKYKNSILASPGYTSSFENNSYERINEVIQYVRENFHDYISLDKAARIIGLTHPAFCRHFKKVSGKTFFSYVKEYRVGHACKLLLQGDMNVAQISYKCGFNSISNFNKQFKEVTGCNPSIYKKRFNINDHEFLQ